jgi:putative membrane protein
VAGSRGAISVHHCRRLTASALPLVIADGVFHLFSANRMSPKLKKFLQSWVINTLAVGLACLILHNHIQYKDHKAIYLLAASLLLGILNSILKPIIMFLALPLLVLTLGLFMFVINALLLYFVGFLLNPYFRVDTFGSAFLGALIISIVSVVLNSLTGTGKTRVQIRRGNPPPRDSGPGGGGPVIDV